jgi:hypothetical protein
MQSEEKMTVNPDQAILDAISAAVMHDSDGIIINSKAFIETFNGHRDRKLCTSLDVAQTEDTPESVAEEVNYFEQHADRFAAAHKGIVSVAQTRSMTDRIKELEEQRDFARAAVVSKCRQYDADMQSMQVALNREIEARGVAQTSGIKIALEAAARIEALEAALREIDNMAPATCEVTLAHQMADIARAALASPVPSTSHSRNQS